MSRRVVHRRTFATACVVLAISTACFSSADAPIAAEIAFVGDVEQLGVVGTPLVPGPHIEIRDAQGKSLQGIEFTVAVVGGGSLDGTPTKTLAGNTGLGTWTLGQTAGDQSLVVESEGVEPLTITARAVAGPPTAASTGGLPTSSAGRVGEPAAPQPQIKLRDAFGNLATGVTVTVQVTGGGSVQNNAPITDTLGLATVGTWTLGTSPGTQRVTLSAGTAPAIVYTATVEPGLAASAVASSAATGAGVANAAAPFSPSVRVTDAYGNPISGVVANVTVGAQSGSVTTISPPTNANGVASAGTWTLGPFVGSQTLSMTVSGLPSVQFTVTATAGLMLRSR